MTGTELRAVDRYVALLRGVNVGGNTRIEMAQLQSVLQSGNLRDIRTYINSGNVLFTSQAGADTVALGAQLTSEILINFGLQVPTVVRSRAQIQTVLGALPGHWVQGGDWRCDAVFLLDGVSSPGAAAALRPRDGVDEVIEVARVILWRVSRSNLNRSALRSVVGTELYRSLTIRNINTLRRIGELLG